MKKTIFQSAVLLMTFLLIIPSLHSQSPQGIPYQAVARNADGSVMAQSPVNLTLTIQDGTFNGPIVYWESHTLTSNDQGLVSCVVGTGSPVQGSFASIDWGNGAKFLHVLMNGFDLGTQQLMSVPYALYSNNVEVRVSETGDSLFVGNNVVIVPGISAANSTDFSALGSQVLSSVSECSDKLISINGCGNQDSIFFDGYYYDLVEIAGQCWFQENLRSTHYNDGSDIGVVSLSVNPNVYVPDLLVYPQAVNYGNYYSAQAVMTDKLCPLGWHIPTHCDWSYMESQFGEPLRINEGDKEIGAPFIDNEEWGITGGNYNQSFLNLASTGVYYGQMGISIDDWNNPIDYENQAHYWLSTKFNISFLDNSNPNNVFWPMHREILGYNWLGSYTLNSSTGSAEGFLTGTFNTARCIKDPTDNPIIDTIIVGCINPQACNYIDGAVVQYVYNPCLISGSACDDFNNNTFNDVITVDCVCAGTPSLFVQGNGVTDIDGNFYPSIILGTQEWMQQNLEVTKYRNGQALINAVTNSSWNTTNGAYGIYGGSNVNNTNYGKLYNWYAVNDSRGLCPTGWHVPTTIEWSTLENYLGGTLVAAGKLKTVDGWNTPNLGATNESGFTGLPGGYRFTDGTYWYNLQIAQWWTSTNANTTIAHASRLYYQNEGVINSTYDKKIGSSVRCLKD